MVKMKNIYEINLHFNYDYISIDMSEQKEESINGWDKQTERQLSEWTETLSKASFLYQYLLDKSFKISTRLSIISIFSSSLLSIFSGIKLWVGDDPRFNSIGDMIMLVSNLIIAAITTASKRYLDDKRTEKIRNYMEQLDRFIAIIYSQKGILPKYRIPADDFFRANSETYTKLMNGPSTSLSEYQHATAKYNRFMASLVGDIPVKPDEVSKVDVCVGTELNVRRGGFI